jgi:hypothetical protein
MCPEKKLEIVVDYFYSGVSLIQYASTCFVSIPSLRKWVKGFTNEGMQALCNEEEWKDRAEMLESGVYDLSKFTCCSEYKFSKEAMRYFESPSEYSPARKMSR